MAEIRKPRKHDKGYEDEFASAFILSKWGGSDRIVEIPPRCGVNTRLKAPVAEQSLTDKLRALASKLCQAHPGISTDAGIFGGVPHIKNVRLSVGDILAKLYVYGDIQKVQEIYSDVSAKQIKEAIAYAQDFLEAACDPESSESDD
jgi:uncharacterized protein (DUF433 family)